jgi:hypothetical protein
MKVRWRKVLVTAPVFWAGDSTLLFAAQENISVVHSPAVAGESHQPSWQAKGHGVFAHGDIAVAAIRLFLYMSADVGLAINS